MKKFLGTLALLLCLLLQAQTAWAAEVYYNGRLLCQSEQIYDSVDGMCVPVRQLFEGLGYEVSWNAEYNRVGLYHPQHGNIGLRLGSRDALILGYFEYQLPVAPYFHDDVLYAPLMLLNHEYCGYNVHWQSETTRWLVSDKQPEFVQPFADLTREQLADVNFHFGKENSSIPIYNAELDDEDIVELVSLLQTLAYRQPAFTGEDIEFSGGNSLDFTLQYADGSELGFGENSNFFYFFREDEEPKGYLPVDLSQKQALKDFCSLLKEKYLPLQNN